MEKVKKKESDFDIKCEVILVDQVGKTYKPGDNVRGKVKYTLTKQIVFQRIGVSLRGFGEVFITWTEGSGKNKTTKYYRNKENYVDIDYVKIDDLIKDNNIDGPTPAGTHEIPFSFVFPENIPPTFNYANYIKSYRTRCRIFYYIRIKFDRPGFSKYNKKFRAEINVGNVAKPTMLTTPIIYGIQKKPFQPFQNKDKIINIKSAMENSVTTPGGCVKIEFEVSNATNLDIKGLKIILNQELTFKRVGYIQDITESIPIEDHTVSALERGDSEVMEFTMNIPPNLMTMQNSNQVSRNYFIEVVVALPFPHRDVVLKMPIEIVNYNNTNSGASALPPYEHFDPPPSYSEVMAEYKKEELGNE